MVRCEGWAAGAPVFVSHPAVGAWGACGHTWAHHTSTLSACLRQAQTGPAASMSRTARSRVTLELDGDQPPCSSGVKVPCVWVRGGRGGIPFNSACEPSSALTLTLCGSRSSLKPSYSSRWSMKPSNVATTSNEWGVRRGGEGWGWAVARVQCLRGVPACGASYLCPHPASGRWRGLGAAAPRRCPPQDHSVHTQAA